VGKRILEELGEVTGLLSLLGGEEEFGEVWARLRE